MMRSATKMARGLTCGAAVLGVVLLAAGRPDAARAQAKSGPFSLFENIFTGSSQSQDPPPQAAVPVASGAQPWSGEDGASGHPLMTAQAIREAPVISTTALPDCGLMPHAAASRRTAISVSPPA